MDRPLEEEYRVLRREEVSRLTGLARATIYAKVTDGSFPPPIRLGARAVGWRKPDIVAWLQSPDRKWDPSEGR